MSIAMDLIGSVVIAAYVIVLGLQLNQNILGNSDASKASLNVQESLVDIVRNIEYDFRKIGYHVTDPKTSIEIATPNHIRYQADVDNDGDIDHVDWYVGAPLTNLPNDSVRVLYRMVNNGTPVGASLGVTEFKLRYLTQDGQETSVLSQIWIVETTLRVESPYKVQDQILTDQSYNDMGYASAFWQQTRLASRNIKRHG